MGGETGQILAEVLLEKLLLEDILRPESLKKYDMRNIKLLSFKWKNSSSFKEIEELKISF